MHYDLIASPLGTLLAMADGSHLTSLHFAGERHAPRLAPDWVLDPDLAVLRAARLQLGEYFAGVRRSFELPLRPRGTPYQQRVWALLREIPYGATTSYGAMAARLGRAGAARAVGAANGRNPVAIVIPCHRAVGADGALTGYAGGLHRKAALLALEGALPGTPGDSVSR
jgi:methylated-DNA-[protein]-cysteine S-methyltransferase